jgi:hypothetical protein
LKKILIIFTSLFVGGISQASPIACVGDYFGYHFSLRANAVKNRVTGTIIVNITNATTNQKSVLKPTASDIRAGQYLRFSGTGRDGSGVLSATFDPGSKTYRGTLNAQTTLGNAQVPVICSMKSRALLEQQFDQDYFQPRDLNDDSADTDFRAE